MVETTAEPRCPICGGELGVNRLGRRRMYCTTRCQSTAGQRAKRERDRASLSKQQRLLIAGAVAPRLRSRLSSRRRINVINADGEVVRKISDAELAMGVLKTASIEFQLDEPIETAALTNECVVCGRLTERRKRGRGKRSSKCIECKNGKCSDCGAIFTSESTLRTALKRGTTPRCASCRIAYRRRNMKEGRRMTRKEMEARIATLEASVAGKTGGDRAGHG